MRAKFLPFLRHVYPLCKIQSSKGYIISNVGAFFLDNSIDSFRRRAIDMFLSSLELTRFQPTKKKVPLGHEVNLFECTSRTLFTFQHYGKQFWVVRGATRKHHTGLRLNLFPSPHGGHRVPGLQHGAHAEVIQAIFVRQHRAGGLEQRIRSTASFLQKLVC